ncbi:hypothetical protein [Mycolicibacterium brisbanense]|uniref:Uncharacterized protein n=1 Tax=Mycolicibacterium brisbanense TaxID=146020 RepID=A0A100VZM3_9MYCO|nr:hypothetical protein [Mycolicibacterium brisbanense]MCV7156170.1 hypothetical protein [Mycolicibacterium brisbanense]GAS88929.1 uncharacterized protein RMCB_3025 [Mycolicibacterium brisbanense]
MSKVRTASANKNVAAQTNTHVASTAAPALITAQQVLFSTAAAVALPRRRYFGDTVSHAISSATTWWRTRAERRPVRHDRPSRMSYLENSMMSREMDRL